MKIDKQIHKALLLEVLNAMTFKGEHAELVVEVKKAVQDAEVEE